MTRDRNGAALRRWTAACCLGVFAIAASAATPSPPAKTAPRAGAEERVVLNFVDADITSVVSALARFLGRNFLFDPRVKGQITLVSEGEVPAATAYGMLASALRMRGFAIVDVGEVSRVVPVADAKQQGGSVNARSPGGGLATRTFRLNYENAEAMVPVLKPLVAAENSIAAYAANNTLVVTDYIDNLERLARIIESIDTPTALDAQLVKLRHGIATDIAALATELLEGSGEKGRRDIVVLADPRSNSIVIRSSSPGRTALARELIGKLESAQGDPGNLHVVYLRNAQAVHLANVLRGLLTGESGDQSATGGGGSSVRAALGAGGMLGGAGAANGGAANGTSATGTQPTSGGATGSTAGKFGGLRGAAGGANGQAQGAAGGTGSASAAFSSGGVTVQADVTTNTLIIAAPDPMYRSLRSVIDLLDQRRAQVLVESLIVEVTERDAAELGIQWMAGGNNGRVRGGTNFGGAGLNANARTTIDAMPRGLNIGVVDGTINLPGVGEVLNLKVLARALQAKDGANILSTPNILTLDNEPASIMVGKTVPFVSGQYITNGNSSTNPFQTIQREDIGLKLNIRPQISEGGTVKLDIYQEVSSIDEQTSGAAGIVTNKRALDTSILVDDGQIMVLGGLMEDSVANGTEAVPGLGSLPVLGNLFRYDKRQRVKTNLMVFLRPYVIRDANASRGLTLDRYNFMRLQQGRARPMAHGLLPDSGAPLLPSADLPSLRQAPEVDLRPQSWEHTRDQPPPPTATASAVRQAPTAAPPPPPTQRSRLPTGVTVESDPAALYGGANDKVTVVQFADTKTEQEALRIVQRVRVSGIGAYIVGGPGGEGAMVRVDVPREPQAVDNAVAVLRELGYRPERVVAP
ncbi:general secretion pathway protein D [Variovorax boronicumulans]|uniref:General secretion pathway protein D n=1 Tax=Variovorax boronicumulans TaxID=436515 RepID=A0AAW8E3W7_9BURK|nr:type II secretion system secretin GspD [Variovorax boronicumulans]MDP9881276.1 general secretion pathway protein D [Variovorax boronicumulans]MDP9926563.1 general secretion pathway protein D [Variovorax boronicumulans]